MARISGRVSTIEGLHAPLSISSRAFRSTIAFKPFQRTSNTFKPFATPSRRPSNNKLSFIRAAANEANGASTSYDYDLFCIGAGSGGVRAARVAGGTYGAKVGICEMPFNPIASDEAGGAGGTCVLRGCVPKKLFVYCSAFNENFKDAEGFGWNMNGAPKLDWKTFLDKKNAELQRLNGIYGNLLKNSGVDYIEGRGRLLDAHTVEIGDKKITAKNILIATGARAFIPEFEGSDLAIISDNALEISEVPKTIAIMGGGYIAVEFAGIFARLGTSVHLYYRQPLPLRGFDEEVRKFAAEQYEAVGIHLHPNCTPGSIKKRADGGVTFSTVHDGQPESLDCDFVLAATGRRPNVHNLGLEAAGVSLTKNGAIGVDDYSRTNVSSVWAIGDVTDRMALTPVALMEAMALTKTLFGNENTKPDYDNIPTAVFSNPELATVGITEEQAIKEYRNVDIYTSAFRPMKNTISGNPGRTFMKLIVAADSGKVVGAHFVGPDSGEMMQGLGVAVKMGVTKTQLDSVVGIHPTAAEEFVTMRSVSRQIREGVPVAA